MVAPHPPAQMVALRDAREQAISHLTDAFAHDLIGIDEFERRLTLAHRANSPSEVALFPPGVTEVHVTAVMGGVQLIVPPSLSVEVSGTAIMGGFGHVERVPVQFDPDRPVLRVHGMAIMGGVGVETRLLGESEEEAHRRRRGERHALSPARRLPP